MWPDALSVACLPRVTKEAAAALQKAGFGQLSDAVSALHRRRGKLADALRAALPEGASAEDCLTVLQRMPSMEVRCAAPRLQGGAAGGGGVDAEEGAEKEEEEVEQYDVQVTLTRHGAAASAGRGPAGKKGSKKARVYAPRCAACCVSCLSVCCVSVIGLHGRQNKVIRSFSGCAC